MKWKGFLHYEFGERGGGGGTYIMSGLIHDEVVKEKGIVNLFTTY